MSDKIKKTVEMVASFSGKINTGNYEQASPFFSVKEILEDVNGEYTDERISERQAELNAMCRERFLEVEERIKGKKEEVGVFGKNDFYRYIRVSRVLDEFYPMGEFPKDALSFYCDFGTLHHKVAEIYFKTGKEVTPKEADPVIYEKLKKETFEINGKEKSLDPDEVDFHNYWAKYGEAYRPIECEKTLINMELGYAGTTDLIMKEKEGLCIGDFKTSRNMDKNWASVTKRIEKYFVQIGAYSICVPGVKKLVIFPLQGVDPIVTTDVSKYENMFLEYLTKFKEKYKEEL